MKKIIMREKYAKRRTFGKKIATIHVIIDKNLILIVFRKLFDLEE